MFHGNAWGMPYAAWLVGADLLLPNRFAQAAPLARFIAAERATLADGRAHGVVRRPRPGPGSVDLSSLRMIMCGGAAVPRSLIEAYEQRFGVRVVQGWGLTETSPVAALSFPPKHGPAEARSTTGPPRAARSAAWRPGWWTTRARCCPATGRPPARSRCAGRG